MYLHLGQETMILESEVVGIFDLDNTTVSKRTREFLAKAEKAGQVTAVTYDLPKSFVVCSGRNGNRLYLSQLAPATLKKRTGLQGNLKKK